MGRPGAETDEWVRSAFDVLSQSPAVQRVGLALVEGGGRRLSFTASDRDRRHVTDWCELDAYADVPLNNTVRTGRPIAGSLDRLAGRYADFVSRQDAATCAVAAVPLVAAGQIMGGFVLYFDAVQPFDVPQVAELARLGEELGERLREGQKSRTLAHRSLAEEPMPDGARVATHRAAGDPRAVAGARRFVQEALDAWQVEGDAADVAVLCVSELVTNAVIHAVAGCEVRLVLHDDVLTLSVRDGGAAVPLTPSSSGEPTDRPSHQPSDDPLDAQGRGLQLVEMLTTRWGSELDADGMTVWCELDLT